MKKVIWVLGMGACGVAGFAAQGRAAVETLGSWSLDSAYNSGETLVSTSGTSPSVDYTEGQSDGLIAGFTPTTLNAGDSLTFSGTISFPSALTGGVQFRAGLMNGGSTPTTTDAGWLGYLAEFPNATDGLGILGARSTPVTGNWPSGTGLTNLANQIGTAPSANAPGTPVTENFSFTLLFNGGSTPNTFTASVISSDSPATYNWSVSGTDPASGDSGSQANAVYNEVGFFFGGSSFGGTNGTVSETDFSNLQVTYTPAVPEPVSAELALIGVVPALSRRRRS